MRNGEWIFCNSGNKGVSLAWTPGLLSKSRIVHIHELGSGANRPICIFYHPLGTYLSTVIPLGQTHEGIFTVGCFLDWYTFQHYLLRPWGLNWKTHLTSHECISMDKNLGSFLNQNHCAFSHPITSVDCGGSCEIRSSPTIQQFLSTKITALLRSNQQAY